GRFGFYLDECGVKWFFHQQHLVISLLFLCTIASVNDSIINFFFRYVMIVIHFRLLIFSVVLFTTCLSIFLSSILSPFYQNRILFSGFCYTCRIRSGLYFRLAF